MSDKPLSLDDDEPSRAKKKRSLTRMDEVESPGIAVVGASVVLFYAKMIFFAIGFALVFIAVDQDATVRTIEFVSFACFFLMASRLAQAEEHRLRDKSRN